MGAGIFKQPEMDTDCCVSLPSKTRAWRTLKVRRTDLRRSVRINDGRIVREPELPNQLSALKAAVALRSLPFTQKNVWVKDRAGLPNLNMKRLGLSVGLLLYLQYQ